MDKLIHKTKQKHKSNPESKISNNTRIDEILEISSLNWPLKIKYNENNYIKELKDHFKFGHAKVQNKAYILYDASDSIIAASSYNKAEELRYCGYSVVSMPCGSLEDLKRNWNKIIESASLVILNFESNFPEKFLSIKSGSNLEKSGMACAKCLSNCFCPKNIEVLSFGSGYQNCFKKADNFLRGIINISGMNINKVKDWNDIARDLIT